MSAWGRRATSRTSTSTRRASTSRCTSTDEAPDGRSALCNVWPAWAASVLTSFSPLSRPVRATSLPNVQVNTGARERLIFEVPSGRQVRDEAAANAIVWFSWTSVLGAEVEGRCARTIANTLPCNTTAPSASAASYPCTNTPASSQVPGARPFYPPGALAKLTTFCTTCPHLCPPHRDLAEVHGGGRHQRLPGCARCCRDGRRLWQGQGLPLPVRQASDSRSRPLPSTPPKCGREFIFTSSPETGRAAREKDFAATVKNASPAIFLIVHHKATRPSPSTGPCPTKWG